MDVREAIYGRRAVREFTTEPVDEAALRGLIDAAIQAPSVVSQQPWRFTIVRDRELLARVSNEAKAHMLRTSPAALASHHFLHILNDPDVRYLLRRHRAGRNLRCRRFLGRRGLFARGREPDARGARGRARDVVDWVCARLARNLRRQIGPEATRDRHAGCPNNRRTSEVRSSRSFEETSEDRLAFVGTVAFPGSDTA